MAIDRVATAVTCSYMYADVKQNSQLFASFSKVLRGCCFNVVFIKMSKCSCHYSLFELLQICNNVWV